MDLRSVPPLSPFNYVEWKLKIVSYIESHDIIDVYFGDGKESYEQEEDWINDCDRSYGSMSMVMSHDMSYLIESVEYPSDLWRNLDRAFGVQK